MEKQVLLTLLGLWIALGSTSKVDYRLLLKYKKVHEAPLYLSNVYNEEENDQKMQSQESHPNRKNIDMEDFLLQPKASDLHGILKQLVGSGQSLGVDLRRVGSYDDGGLYLRPDGTICMGRGINIADDAKRKRTLRRRKLSVLHRLVPDY